MLFSSFCRLPKQCRLILPLSMFLAVISFTLINPINSLASEFPIFTLAKPELNIYRISPPPQSDGTLADDVWSKIKVIGDLHQIFPKEYQKTTFKNEKVI